MLITKHYHTENYSLIFNTESGFFARIEDSGWPEPHWSQHGPELMDIAVTSWCDRECFFCYRTSGLNGIHMQLAAYRTLLQQASDIGVLQVALGGGNPNQHPDFVEMLRLTRGEYGIVPSYTTNGRGLSREILEASKRWCGAVAVSAYSPYQETIAAIQKLLNLGVKTNVHYILDRDSVDTAIEWLKTPPAWLRGVNALIFLSFKPTARSDCRSTDLNARLARNSPNIAAFFRLASAHDGPFKIGFDSCCTTGILAYGDFNAVYIEACESARFSMFVSERMKAYPCSFMAEAFEGHRVTQNNLREIWQHGKLFTDMRNSLSPSRCTKCTAKSNCLGGCPIFPQINICE